MLFSHRCASHFCPGLFGAVVALFFAPCLAVLHWTRYERFAPPAEGTALALGLNGSASLTANHTAGLMLPHDASTAGMKSHLQGGELTVAIPRVLPVDVAIE